tara:strand:+ start:892 stop:1161 length:270 start_codon:yes stop_codon:yes gene_type:complete
MTIDVCVFENLFVHDNVLTQLTNSIVVFNDSHQADGFVKGVDTINTLLEEHELRVKLQFIEDFVSDEGEYAYCVRIVSDDLPKGERDAL